MPWRHRLRLAHAALPRSARIYHYYLPTYLWVLRKLEAHRAAHAGPGAPPALVVRLVIAEPLGASAP